MRPVKKESRFVSAIEILTDAGFLPARDFIKTLPASVRDQLLVMVELFEEDGEIRHARAASDGIGRYKVQVVDVSKRLKTFILEARGESGPEEQVGFFKEYLYFVPQETAKWRVPEPIYEGRPGEAAFIQPAQVSEVLDAIKEKRPSKDYELQADGKYQIRIERPSSRRHPDGILIIGYAVWKNRKD